MAIAKVMATLANATSSNSFFFGFDMTLAFNNIQQTRRFSREIAELADYFRVFFTLQQTPPAITSRIVHCRREKPRYVRTRRRNNRGADSAAAITAPRQPRHVCIAPYTLAVQAFRSQQRQDLVESEWSQKNCHFESLVCKLQSMSSQIQFHIFPMTFFAMKWHPTCCYNVAQ